MLKHIVFFNFRDEALGAVKAENIIKAKAMLEALMSRVPTLLSMHAGANTVPGTTAWDFALIAEFENEEALRAYVEHPEHKKVSEFMSQVRSGRASADIVVCQ